MTTKNLLKFILAVFIFSACSSRVIPIKTLQDANYSGMTQEFNVPNLYGKWLTNMPAETTSFIVFKNDNTVITNTNREGKYTIKKDSITIMYDDATARGRLLEQTDSRLYILWGGGDPVKYYRPESF